jgi:2-C-methyl-D-erythritol 2,4-cyclodiphosphate synthase
MKLRVGQGFDVHALVEGRPLVLGGVTIPFDRGLKGHSDADVLIHAVMDALLGAAGLGDIGQHFPDQDAQYKNIDSRILLRQTQVLLAEHQWEIQNIDATLMAEAPKIAPYKMQMVKNLSADLHITPEQIHIKATTTEQLGFVGRQEGMACLAVALIVKMDEG